jgi:lipopolysaccharide transport system ATP-binding protein
MSEIVIQAEALSKLYRLGTLGTGSLKQDLARWWKHRILKKQDPFFSADGAASGGHLWALKDVGFDIREGEVWGIVGHNGAGKSTLLKILSRIVRPTEGVVRGKGRISSLLEVGTGFHQELTGRENIYISGYMLGMKKAEIRQKFDEIVEFSGIEAFLDTPVKRYSSGMYVRLAFAVAAHLEPDILIVDEVLAVGDAEFQKRCMGKMKDVSTQRGRTIIFVSHNLQAVDALCTRALCLQKGRLVANGDAHTVINGYLSGLQKRLWKEEWNSIEQAPGNEHIHVLSVEMIPELDNPGAPIDIRTPITVRFRFYNHTKGVKLVTELLLFTLSGECIFVVACKVGTADKGMMEGEVRIPENFLNDGSYYFSLFFAKEDTEELFYFEECLHFDVKDYREGLNLYVKWWGYVRPQFPFRVTKCSD